MIVKKTVWHAWPIVALSRNSRIESGEKAMRLCMPAKIAMLPTRKIFRPYVSLSLPHSPLTSISATAPAPE